LKRYSKGVFKVNRQDGIEISGECSPFIDVCIGIGIVLFSSGVFLFFATPLLRTLR